MMEFSTVQYIDYSRYDPNGEWSWNAFQNGVQLGLVAALAITVSVSTFGIGTPLAVTLVAYATLGAGIATGVNAASTLIESAVDYNIVRDGLFSGVLGLDENAYYGFSDTVSAIASFGTLACSAYQTTGRYKASKIAEDYIGDDAQQVSENRWTSGNKQVRLDLKARDGAHFNLETWKNEVLPGINNTRLENIHQYFDLFNTWR